MTEPEMDGFGSGRKLNISKDEDHHHHHQKSKSSKNGLHNKNMLSPQNSNDSHLSEQPVAAPRRRMTSSDYQYQSQVKKNQDIFEKSGSQHSLNRHGSDLHLEALQSGWQ